MIKPKIMLSLAGIRFDRGMGEYVKSFLPYLCQHYKHNLLIVYEKEIPKELLQIVRDYGSLFFKKELPYPIVEQIYIPKIISEFNIKVAYFPANTFPIVKPKSVKYIVTIHDLIFLRKDIVPESFYQKIGKFYRSWVIKNGVQKIDALISVSNSTLKDFNNLFKYKTKADITKYTIYNPFDFDCVYREDENILSSLNLKPKEFLYTITGVAKNKNVEFLLESFAKVAYNIPHLKLVISGINNIENQSKYKTRLKKLNIEQSVIFTSYINETQKRTLIRNCKAFLFLSRYEGFGRPIIEALFENAVVVASDIKVFREIGDRYIHYIDINNTDSLLNLLMVNKFKTYDYMEILSYLKSKFDVKKLTRQLLEIIDSNLGDIK